MKKLHAALLLGALALAGSAHAQTAQEIVKKHNDAIGGAKNWSKISSLKKEGSLNAQGMDIPYTITILKGKGMRQDFTVMGQANYLIITPGAGWTYMPVQGQTKPEPLPADQLDATTETLDFQDHLMTAAEKKYTVTLDGKEEINGKQCFKLKVTDAAQKESIYFIDPETFYIVRMSKKATVQGQEMEVVYNYSDYKKLPEGIVVAMKEENGDDGSMTFSNIEANTVKDDSIFKPTAQ